MMIAGEADEIIPQLRLKLNVNRAGVQGGQS